MVQLFAAGKLVRGGPGPDTLSGGSDGADTVRAFAGDDKVLIFSNLENDKPRAIIADGGVGSDLLFAVGDGIETFNRLDLTDQSRNTGTFRGGHFINFESYDLSDAGNHFARFDFVGTAIAEHVRVGANADSVAGGGGNDTIEGGAGGDVLAGGFGNDLLRYHSNGMTINLGTNAASGGDAAGDIISGFENIISDFGLNRLTGTAGDNRIESGGADTINGAGGADTIVSGTGSRILGGAGDDHINAGGGTIDGGAGDDVIVTSAFTDDHLKGGAGGDTITGGFGQDTMTGGGGGDRFVFTTLVDTAATRSAGDVVTDFAVALDRIDLRAIDAKAHTDGNNFFKFISGAAFSAEGQVRVSHAGGDTYVELNTNGKSGAEAIVKFDGAVVLGEDNFLL
jgi:Ca2+-binding RTX toxin-like protein